MEVKASLRYYRQSPRKVRLLVNLVRGLDVAAALDQLTWNPGRAATPLRKLLASAVANATHNFAISKDNLRIKTMTVDNGPTLKRWRARAFGRAAEIRKKTSHVTVILEEKVPSAVKEKSSLVKKPAANDLKTVNKLSELKADQVSASADAKISKPKRGLKGFTPKVFQRKAG